METISVSQLKSHLSEELRKVEKGISITILDHKRPVAIIQSYRADLFLFREAASPYLPSKLTPLIVKDPLEYLSEEREESW
jgi:antitoxin (DNA-binding transcriptional repressor) of toxin-antitoxin stability system